MSEFSRNPIINSPYAEPSRHWKLDDTGAPTQEKEEGRRAHRYFIPIPAARRQRELETGKFWSGLAEEQTERTTVNSIRAQVRAWRAKPPQKWGVTHVTRRFLEHWRGEQNCNPRLFFCQLEAIETFIWLNEVAPSRKQGKEFLREIREANAEANANLMRMAAKMATGAGKTTVMAMLIAYHAVNHARALNSKKFAGRFLVIAPGITIRDRLRVLLPQDPENYYETRGIVPPEFMAEVKNAVVVITNYQAFQRRELQKASGRERAMVRGNTPEKEMPNTKEPTGLMLKRACPGLVGGAVVVINDEAHHCYKQRERTEEEKRAEEAAADADDKEEAKRSKEAARLWINGIYDLQEKTPVCGVYDLSATPFFLRGSGYPEGHLFPWVVSDFSLMEAIECGIVKLPRVPVQDSAQQEMPIYRDIYSRIVKRLPKAGRQTLNPKDLPTELASAIYALHGSYKKTAKLWAEAGTDVPPVFIVVCNNTSVSRLVYGLLSGWEEKDKKTGKNFWHHGEYGMFNNVGADDKPLARPKTLLIDSYRLESGEALTPEFKAAAAVEIEQFKNDLRIRFPERDADKITDEDLLREVMNTIGKRGKLGEQIRCVVSVSMLTEGWDTNTVTHILGVRKFGTQLLCEQIVGRGLRRLSYDVDENGMFAPEYADVFGVPFSFVRGDSNAKPVQPQPKKRVRNLWERRHFRIDFPRVRNYIVRPPKERIVADFSADSRLVLTDKMAPQKTEQRGIVGEGVMITLKDLEKRRENEVVYYLSAYICENFYKQAQDKEATPSRFMQIVPIVRRWMQTHLDCAGQTRPQYLLWQSLAKIAAEKIYRACTPSEDNTELLLPIMDPYTPYGSTMYVDFLTGKKRLHNTEKSHINIAVCDSDWEEDFCKNLEEDAGVFAYVRNDGLGFEVPYTHAEQKRIYKPDFIVLANDGKGRNDLLHLVVEIKGLKDEAARAKADTMQRLWVPAVNNFKEWGRWAFEEIMDMQDAQKKLAKYTRGGAAE